MSSERASGPGMLIVVSAPSGTGKTTLVDELVRRLPGVEQSRSYTSRPARAGERDGVDYTFVSRDTFDAMVERDEFLEWADLFGHRYGTGRADIARVLERGVDVVLVIDVQGARQIRGRAEAVTVFVLPPSFAALEVRLRSRSQDAEDAIRRRLATARHEIGAVEDYEYVVVNDDLDRCVAEVMAIVQAERARRRRRGAIIDAVRRTFGEGAS
ncbi:MAG TPA: guanylate kinase [Vicinamibacterales bacterium]|nr:guanylate kinase [Vicinamibacterales bacterium]